MGTPCDDEVNSFYFEIHSSDDFGRYLVAKEDIDEKTLILAETPLVYGPVDDRDVKSELVYKFCIACCRKLYPGDDDDEEISQENLHNCSMCGWPVCDKHCEKDPIHSENECKVFSLQNLPYPPPHEWFMFKSVVMLRLLLFINRDPFLWTNFLEKLEHHTESRSSKENCTTADELILGNLEYFTNGLKYLPKKRARKYRLPLLTDKDTLTRLIGTLNVNAFCANNNLSKRIARCMFKTASLFAHSCAPNCSWSIEMSLLDQRKQLSRRRRKAKNGVLQNFPNLPKVTPQIHVYTAVPVKKGEMITIPYSTRHIFYGTLKRQIKMESVGHFICKCRRCMDQTELGTFMSSIRCFKCESGFLVSSDTSNQESEWICTKRKTCDGKYCVEKVVYFVTTIQDQIDYVRSRDLHWYIEYERLQFLFVKHCGEDLHRNHYLLQELSTRILELLEDKLDEIREMKKDRSEFILGKFLFHANYLMQIANIILPGFNQHQDQLKFYLDEATAVKIAISEKPEIISKS